MNTLLARMEFDTAAGRWIRRLRRRYNDHCISILTYHSISKERSVFTDGTDLRHHPAQFERQIDYLVENYNLISLRELIAALEARRPLHRAVSVTFDDGFADALRCAMPILLRRRIPMTVFPVASVIGNTDLMWQHKLAWLMAHGHTARVVDALEAEGYPPCDDDTHLALFARHHYRHDLPEVLESVLRSIGTSGPSLAAACRPYVEPDDLVQADPELVEVANHTYSHPVLSALSAEQQRREIVAARDAIESLTGLAPIALAYPFGLKRHSNGDSRRIAQETGHRAALDLRRRINTHLTDPFELSRKPVPRGLQNDFEKMVEDWPANAPASHAGGVI